MNTSTTSYKTGEISRSLTVVTRKGQITIPAHIREALGIKEGDAISVTLEGDEVKLEPVSLSLAESYQSIPALTKARSWKEVLEIARDDHVEGIVKKG